MPALDYFENRIGRFTSEKVYAFFLILFFFFLLFILLFFLSLLHCSREINIFHGGIKWKREKITKKETN